MCIGHLHCFLKSTIIIFFCPVSISYSYFSFKIAVNLILYCSILFYASLSPELLRFHYQVSFPASFLLFKLSLLPSSFPDIPGIPLALLLPARSLSYPPCKVSINQWGSCCCLRLRTVYNPLPLLLLLLRSCC